MADSIYKFYCERAEAAALAASNATLENVRDRELRAEKTWRGLAGRAREISVQRERAERDKADQRSAQDEPTRRDEANEPQSKLP